MMCALPRPNDKETLRRFGIVMGGMIAGLFGLLIPWLSKRQFAVWPWVLASLFLSCALLVPEALRIVYRVWMRIGAVLGAINGRIVLGIIYYLIVVPMGLAMRLWGTDPLARNFAREQTTYRIVRKEDNLVERMERPF